MTKGVALWVVFLAGTTMALAGKIPPPRPAKQELTYKGKEVYEGRRVLYEEDSYPREPGKLVEGPTVKREGRNVKISFMLDKPDDVLVRIVNMQGKIVRNVACGVLGWNAPEPFTKDSLRQEIIWDGKDVAGRPAPPDCKVCVCVGLTPRFDRFAASDPLQLSMHIIGIEIDAKGRVYVTLSRIGSALDIVRFDREGRYLDTVFPLNPTLLAKRKELPPMPYGWVYVDGKPAPCRRGWRPNPFFYHVSTFPTNPQNPLSALRIDSRGRAYIFNNNNSRKDSQEFIPVETDPMLIPGRFPQATYEGGFGVAAHCCFPWALDSKGAGYYAGYRYGRGARLEGFTVRKLDVVSGKPLADFEYHGAGKLAEKRYYLGTEKEGGEDGKRFTEIEDISVDGAGNIFVADAPALKMYRADGKFLGSVSDFELRGERVALGHPINVRAVDDTFYVLSQIGRREEKRGIVCDKTLLVKFTGEPRNPKTVWSMELPREARHLAVDTNVKSRILWIGNGNGPATLSRIVDHGKKTGAVKHIGGIREGALVRPGAVGLDGKGRLYVVDLARWKIIRVNADGSGWLEGAHTSRASPHTMLIDHKRGWIYFPFRRYDLDLKDRSENVSRSLKMDNFGAVDADGNLYVNTDAREKGRGRIDCVGSDGTVKKTGFIEGLFNRRGGLAMDSKECIYVVDSCKVSSKALHDMRLWLTWSRKEKKKVWPWHWRRGKKRLRIESELAYLVKFGPGGGKRGTESEHWVHLGVSPVLGHCRCALTSNNVAVDEADRIFASDVQRYHVKVIDTAGNLIARVGAWGNRDCAGPESKYPDPEIAFDLIHSLTAGGDFLYVSDQYLRRVVKVRLDYREVKAKKVSSSRPN